ncbi:hypothetical protein B0H14DRAFT_2680373 [Mycena olivaceomarginata]|nr:hypothetical protein B0H14DRAFT_2680373 [Mycena olivaceomarginata]
MATGDTPATAAPPEPDEHTAEMRAKNPWLYEDEHLLDAGYLLRPRYSPTWSAPWKSIADKPWTFEESVMPPSSLLIDATRSSDGSYVVLKRCDRLNPSVVSGALREGQIFEKLFREPLASDPKNHCIRLIEILHVPDDPATDLIVIPLLTPWQSTHFPFVTIGEAVEFFSQIFEGLQFLHNHNIWHGDCKANNIMMDASPILRADPHPWDYTMTRDYNRDLPPVRTRTRHPVKYYWLDFDLSDEYDPSKGPPLVDPGYGGTPHVPEFSFPIENGSELYSQEKMQGFEFMHGLVAAMTQEDPAKRPNMDEVVRQFSKIKAGLSPWKLRSRFTSERRVGIVQSATHWARQLYLMARRIPAIPTP